MESLSNANISRLPTQLPGTEYHVHIPDGRYVVGYMGYEGFRFFRDPRVIMWLVILEGEYAGKFVPAYYNVKERGEWLRPRCRSPEFVVGQKAKLAIDLGMLDSRLSPSNLPTSISDSLMRSRPILVETGTIKKCSDGHPKPDAFHGSKVVRIMGWAE